ncbi:hypothetical protein [Lactobacillus sp. ESL0681]|uniref:hypothetical protein n=1 Tax=Lactobacillus sp. ESL0681 TaxID=2983211 RepID=UPI0023F8300D|nr:hypothetical protein [Lactobacillus sp. ESL0681]WEV41308.1 hypothetical protein OZX59_09265 [Lactobacillus sp. ESL0681]
MEKVTVKGKMLENEFEKTREIVADVYGQKAINNASVVGVIFGKFVPWELDLEKKAIKDGNLKQHIAYQKIYPSDRFVTFSLDLNAQLYANIETDLANLYPDLAEKGINTHEFLAHMGFIFSTRIKAGQVTFAVKDHGQS